MSDDFTIIPFDNFEQMLEIIAEKEKEANDQMLGEQVELMADIHNTRYWAQPAGDSIVFGMVFSQSEREAMSLKGADDAEAKAEAAYEIEVYRESRQRGYLFSRKFDRFYPDGELGDVHVTQVWPISEQAFNEAKAHGWKAVALDPLMARLLEVGAFPADAIANKITPTLNAELDAADQRRRQVYGDR